MKLAGIMLILAGIAGVAYVITYKRTKRTIQFIGPKSRAAFILCGICAIAGVMLVLFG